MASKEKNPERIYYEEDGALFHIIMKVGDPPLRFIPEGFVFLDSFACEYPNDLKLSRPVDAKYVHFVFVKKGSEIQGKYRSHLFRRTKGKVYAAQ